MFIKINTEWEPRRKRKTDEVEEQIDEYDIEPRVRTLRTRREQTHGKCYGVERDRRTINCEEYLILFWIT